MSFVELDPVRLGGNPTREENLQLSPPSRSLAGILP
jgi:hypothetical protein